MKHLSSLCLLLFFLLSCGGPEDLTPTCQVDPSAQPSRIRFMLQNDSIEWPGDLADSPDTLEICQQPVNGTATLTKFNEVVYQPNIPNGSDSMITKRFKVNPTGTTVSIQKHRFRIYENAGSRCLDLLTNSVDTVRETIKVSTDEAFHYRSHPVLWYCKDFIDSFISIQDPSIGEVSLEPNANYAEIYYLNSTTAQAGDVDVFELKMCIDTGTTIFCKQTIFEYTYVN